MGRPYHILALDGGPSTIDYLRQLRVVEVQRPGFLDRVDLFAGTSDGAWVALLLASRPPGTSGLDAIDAAIAFNLELVQSLHLGLWGTARLLTGVFAAVRNDQVLATLRRAYGQGPGGEPMLLGDLARDVCIVSFHMGNQPIKPGARIFHTLARHGVADDVLWPDQDRADLRVPLAEAALRSGSFPVLLPVRAGYSDGALVANNPAMFALTQVMQYHRPLKLDPLTDIVMLSCGADDATLGGKWVDAAVAGGRDLGWGWLPWLLLPMSPLMLLDAVITASGRGVAFQVRQLLRQRFLRMGPPMSKTFGQQILRLISGRIEPMYAEADAMAAAWAAGANGIAYTPAIDQVLAWVDSAWAAVEVPPAVEAEAHARNGAGV